MNTPTIIDQKNAWHAIYLKKDNRWLYQLKDKDVEAMIKVLAVVKKLKFDAGISLQEKNARGPQTRDALALHTDPGDILGMCCINPAAYEDEGKLTDKRHLLRIWLYRTNIISMSNLFGYADPVL